MNTPSSFWGQRARLFCIRRALFLALVGFLAAPLAAAQDRPEPEYELHVVIVQFEPGIVIGEGVSKAGLQAFDRAAARYGVHTIERMFPFLDHVQPTPETARNLAALRRTYYVRYSADDDPGDVAKALMAAPGVTYAETHAVPVLANRFIGTGVTVEPDDSLFSDQTYLRHMRLPEAWDIVKGEDGNPPVVIAITDTGGDWRHEDLLANVWTNANEIPGNGIDDDNNGFIDDVHGVNLGNGDDADNDPYTPGNTHGTHVAGVASAVTDNSTGVAGAAWNARLMHIHGYYRGILYAAANGADIINTSWVTSGSSKTSTQALDLATDMGALVVAGAANSARNIDDFANYPYGHPRVLAVGATAKDSRRKAGFSNYGKGVDVFAPGVDIITTAPEGEYALSIDGTSFASPLVSGVAALVKTRYPDISPDALREQIRLSSENMDAENPGYAGLLGRGYVHAEAALQTPELPAIRVKRWSWTDSDGDKEITSGEEVMIAATMVNYLADARQLSVGLTTAQSYPYIDITTAEQTVGRLARGDSTEVTLRFTVAPDAPVNSRVRFYTRIRDGAFVDEPDQFAFGVNRNLDVVHAALSALYVSTNGNLWDNNSDWDITTVPSLSRLSRWHGVSVYLGLMDGLSLSGNNLTGILPIDLGDLSSLRLLKLGKNSLTGEIPSTLGNLSQLRELDLKDNFLTGAIPIALGSLPRLQRLDLSGNTLSWAIPGELGNLSQMQRLDLSDNFLTGTIPSELGNLSKLQWLYLQGNALTGRLPRSFMRLENLQRLNFGDQDLCAPADDAFQAWLGSISKTSGPTCSGIHFADNVPDQSFTRAQPIAPIVLPEAIGGASRVDYTLTPALPEALTFDKANRTISGKPTSAMSATPYTYKATDANGATDRLTFSIEVIFPDNAEDESLPQALVLHGNYPNPFRHSTRLTMDLPWPARVTVEVMDVVGRRVLTVPSVDLAPGWQRGIDLSGASLSSGLYLYRVHASSPKGSVVQVGRFVRIR